ncbi:hypothetical protein KY385_01520 [Candidatus Parcubacteria bacterium]|nr:hypothetical protein [Candidatus Parcubacteria bacterium]
MTNPNKLRPSNGNRLGDLGNARRVGVALLAAAVVVPGAELVREAGFYELRDKPALKDKVNGVKQHQRDLQGIVEDAQYSPLGVAKAAPISTEEVRKLRLLLGREDSLDKAVPPIVETTRSKGGGSSSTVHFSSPGSRKATVAALEYTIEATRDTKLNSGGMKRIYAEYEKNLAENRGAVAQHEEAAVTAGLEAVDRAVVEALNDKPLLNAAGYTYDLEQRVGLTPDGKSTADYPPDNHSPYAVPIEVLPETIEQAIAQLPGSPEPSTLQIILSET